VRALAKDHGGVLRRETVLARKVLRTTFVPIRLVPEAGAVYAEIAGAANLLSFTHVAAS
jgi:hypothetical protein